MTTTELCVVILIILLLQSLLYISLPFCLWLWFSPMMIVYVVETKWWSRYGCTML